MSAPLQTWPLLVASGAVLGLDHAAWPSLLLAQPLCAGALAGACCGHFEAGVAAGAVVQLLFLGTLPVGGALLPEAWLGGIAAAVAAPPDVQLAGGAWLDDPRLAAPVVAGIAAAYLGRALLARQRVLQSVIARRAQARLEGGDARSATHAVGLGMLLHAGRGAFATLLVLALAPLTAALLTRLGFTAPAGRLALAFAAVTLAVRGRRRERPWLFVSGALLGGVAAWL